MALLKVGELAPDFNVASDKAGQVSREGLKGRKVVLFFYPKDDTPGCTKESCEFRDLNGEFDQAGAAVFGVSADDVTSHEAFASKFSLNFPLLADTEKVLCEGFGVWGEQEWGGKKFMGIARTTFLLDEESKVAKVYADVTPLVTPRKFWRM